MMHPSKLRNSPLRLSLALGFALFASQAVAGPPYHTDDPDPTETGGVEAYAFTEGNWDRGYSGSAAIEANFGAAKDVQLSFELPLDLTSRPSHFARGNVELSAKWRFLNDDVHGWSLATFPGVTLPTARGARGIEVLLPVWGGWRHGDVAIFGGGGRMFIGVPGGHDHWVLGLAATRQFGSFNVGIEAGHEGAAERSGHGINTAGVGIMTALTGPIALVVRAGPAQEEGTGHVFVQTYFGLQGVWGPKK